MHSWHFQAYLRVEKEDNVLLSLEIAERHGIASLIPKRKVRSSLSHVDWFSHRSIAYFFFMFQ